MIFALVSVFFIHALVFLYRYKKYRKSRDFLLIFTFSFLTIAYIFVATETLLIIDLSWFKLRIRDLLRIAAAMCTLSAITLFIQEKISIRQTKAERD